MQVERSCEDCYKAEYMNAHIGEEFQGTVVSAVEFGLFIALPDTCEGLLHTDNMPDGEYVCDDMVSLKNLTTAWISCGRPYQSKGDKRKCKLRQDRFCTC